MQSVKETKSLTRLLAEAKSARKKGAEAKAEELYREILARYPGNKSARKALTALTRSPTGADFAGVLDLFHRRRYAETLTAVTAFLKSDPDNTAALKIQAACFSVVGEPEPALEIYWRLLAQNRDNAGYWQKAGAILFEMLRTGEAVDCLKLAAKLAPEDPKNWMLLARCHHHRGEYTLAYDALAQTLGRDPANCLALVQLGQVLRDLGKTDLAEGALERALEVASTADQRSAAANGLGAMKSAKGDKPAARARYRRAIRDDPGNVRPLLNLARMPEAGIDDDLPDRLRSIADEPGLTLLERSQTHFALFTLLDRSPKEADKPVAFDHLQRGNDLRRKIVRYDPRQQAAMFAYIKKQSVEIPAVTTPEAGVRPIFVVGMPRSGTTLTEQMLSAADGVRAGGEMTDAESLSRTLMQQAWKAGRTALSDDEMQDFSTTLRARMTAMAGETPAVIDKMPLNFRWVGHLLNALPDARVIHIHRDPLETCWSNYKSSYATHGNGFAYNLTDLATYYHLYTDLTTHWETLFPDRFRTIGYSSLVAETEPVMRGLVEFCDLGWSDDCLHPERATRAVLTASEHQVRLPVYNGNKGDWRRYEGFLGPLVNGLAV